jgi:hypothetical protein
MLQAKINVQAEEVNGGDLHLSLQRRLASK